VHRHARCCAASSHSVLPPRRRLTPNSRVACFARRLSATLQQKLPLFYQNPQQHWRQIEGCVYCLRQSISSNDPTFFAAPAVGELLQLLPTLPAIGQLQPTAIRTVGTYSNWLSKNPTLLPPMLQFVSNGLMSEATAAAASQAMKHLCDSCAEHLASEDAMRQLLQMYLGTLQLQLAAVRAEAHATLPTRHARRASDAAPAAPRRTRLPCHDHPMADVGELSSVRVRVVWRSRTASI
jgi:hypothetical protein